MPFFSLFFFIIFRKFLYMDDTAGKFDASAACVHKKSGKRRDEHRFRSTVFRLPSKCALCAKSLGIGKTAFKCTGTAKAVHGGAASKFLFYFFLFLLFFKKKKLN